MSFTFAHLFLLLYVLSVFFAFHVLTSYFYVSLSLVAAPHRLNFDKFHNTTPLTQYIIIYYLLAMGFQI